MLQNIRFKHFTVESSLGYPFVLFALLYFLKSIPRVSPVAQMVKNLPAMQETQLQSESRRSPGEGNGNPLQYSCLENSMDSGLARLQSMGSQRVRHHCETNFPFLPFLVFYILSYLLSKRMDCLSRCLVSYTSIQKLFCGSCSEFK